MATDYQGTYSVSTGTDIYAVFNNIIMSTAQGVSYSVTRQKAPVYTLGSSDPRAIARSKRGIAGSMIMTTFDRHCLADFIIASDESKFYGKNDELANSAANPWRNQSVVPTSLPNVTGISLATPNPQADLGFESRTPAAGQNLATRVEAMYADQLLPFDLTLASMNEYGKGQAMRIYAVEFLNEGSGVSIDDTSNEVQLTYIARMMSGWIPQTAING